MPEVMFDVRWPDGSARSYYSPSLIVEEYFSAGSGYPVSDFLDRSRTCMRIADERVQAKYGFGCAQSRRTLDLITESAARFDPADEVTVESFRR
ncbi:putative repeat protein (TIGR04042 family) [Pseudonocardia sediminis]|uniref:Putative repeat protein (TIGR04042 family) n=1 Tax=Pseudonocardia sediminis TaxID=1397368 RepID=A0A4Q7V688_PSEST|nr:MSMEG_0570 family nitrogen starvation response protein [Pseudonocardia sediminis]RZT88209.1 putative repeat protein (TIGR04042 family) [Pseudonocardia sediminis]